MVFVKTDAGQLAFRQRSEIFTPRQRSAFIFFDGNRSVQEVLRATSAMGVTQDDIRALVDNDLLAPAVGRASGTETETYSETGVDDAPVVSSAGLAAGPASVPASLANIDTEQGNLSAQERYSLAYPLALKLTSGLGLRGFRLNLAVEGAGSFEQMLELAPKILAAVGPEKFEPLRKALRY